MVMKMREMKKSIYHPIPSIAGGYKVLEINRTEQGDFYISLKHGVKGEKESRETISMKLSHDELAGLFIAIERMLLIE